MHSLELTRSFNENYDKFLLTNYFKDWHLMRFISHLATQFSFAGVKWISSLAPVSFNSNAFYVNLNVITMVKAFSIVNY